MLPARAGWIDRSALQQLTDRTDTRWLLLHVCCEFYRQLLASPLKKMVDLI